MKIDELIERLEKMAFDFKWENGIGDKYVELANEAAEAIRVLNAVPAADVVEVVRCKDCKYYYAYPDEYRTCHEHYEIDGATKMMATEDFCSKGERREVRNELG